MALSFQTIAKSSEVLYVDKASKFIAFCSVVYNEEDIKKKLAALREIHPKSNHHCYAYRLGLDLFNYRANDDGEPSGSAGKPILGQIDSFELTNTLVVVVRYFGGTKLGVSGLISAYKKATQLCLEKAGKKTIEISYQVNLVCSYLEINEVLNFLKKLGIEKWQQDYTEDCKISFNVLDSSRESLASWLEKNEIEFTIKSNF